MQATSKRTRSQRTIRTVRTVLRAKTVSTTFIEIPFVALVKDTYVDV